MKILELQDDKSPAQSFAESVLHSNVTPKLFHEVAAFNEMQKRKAEQDLQDEYETVHITKTIHPHYRDVWNYGVEICLSKVNWN
jgi:hypothetical protein